MDEPQRTHQTNSQSRVCHNVSKRAHALTRKIAVIGAGISGITVARGLAGLADVTVFERSNELGGRMARRLVEPFAFDHGAQYFTARGQAFQEVVADAMEKDAVGVWPLEIRSFFRTLNEPTDRVIPRYVGRPAMNGLAIFMAGHIQINRETEITSLGRSAEGWHLIDQNETSHGPFDLVVSSAPAPQTASLLPSEFKGHLEIASARMSGCFTLMIGHDAQNLLPFEAARVEDPVLSWIAVDNSKPDRDGKPSLVIHSRNDWADNFSNADRGWVKATMLKALADITGREFSGALWSDLHRWRFANVDRAIGKPYLLDAETGLAACGDWCLGNRVEAAFESGRCLGLALRAWIATESDRETR